MANGSPLYTPADLAYYAREYADTSWLVHVIGPDDVLLHSDTDDDADHEPRVPFTLETADQAAAAINRTYAWTQENNPSEFDPFFHATVFHYGKPLAAPDTIAPAPSFSADDLAWFKETWGNTAWVAYVHGQDECFDRRNDDDPLFTEDTVRKYAADMAMWDREHVAQGLPSTPVTVFRHGVPVEAEAVTR
jgi:hypothetical protein